MKANKLTIGQRYIWRRNSSTEHEVIYLGCDDSGKFAMYEFEYIKEGEKMQTLLSVHHVNSDIEEIYNVGEVIQFYRCCNSDRKLYEGAISAHKGLGLIVLLEGEIHEVRKMIDIKKLVEIV